MTAHELARKLLDGPDLMVTVCGYEGGVNEINSISNPEPIVLNMHKEWYYGKHEYASEHTEKVNTTELPRAIHIGA